MKRYEGHPGTPGRVLVFTSTRGGKGRPIRFRPTNTPSAISWGKADLALAWICLAILDDVFEPSDRTLRLMQRFKHRMIPNWKDGYSWTLTEDEVRAVVADIEANERATAQSRVMAAQEPAPVLTDMGGDVKWTRTDAVASNLKRNGAK